MSEFILNMPWYGWIVIGFIFIIILLGTLLESDSIDNDSWMDGTP